MVDGVSAAVRAHDPGGKVRIKLRDGMRGDAEFSICGKYRTVLTRRWDNGLCGWIPFMLWVGMNPSTAEADVDDPTIRREIGFTERLGYYAYVKCNVLDYRATNPKSLLDDGVVPCSPKNHRTIRQLADEADLVVAAWGVLPKPLRHHAVALENDLRGDGVSLLCLGKTKDRAPRHPLYVKSSKALEPYP